MIWAILALLGIPLWLCAGALVLIAVRRRALRRRPGSVKVRRRLAGKSRWTRGYGVWVRDVFVFNGSAAVWTKSRVSVRDVVTMIPTPTDGKKLRRLGPAPAIVRLFAHDRNNVDFATPSGGALELLGPFAVAAAVNVPVSS